MVIWGTVWLIRLFGEMTVLSEAGLGVTYGENGDDESLPVRNVCCYCSLTWVKRLSPSSAAPGVLIHADRP